jgi:peroxiredoxin
MIKALALLLAVLALAAPAAANPNFDLGPPTGAKAPPIGELPDATGKPRPLASLMGDKGLVLFFFRSAKWCPYCQAQLIDINSGAAEIEKRGYRIAGISYEPPQVDADFTARRGIVFPLLSDKGSVVIDRYRLRDPQYPQGNMAYGAPRPIIFILDAKGVIRAKLYEDSFMKRPPVGLVIQTIDGLKVGPP